MRRDTELSPGWLREEIGTALRQVTEKSYVSEELKSSFQTAAAAIDRSESLRRPNDSPKQTDLTMSIFSASFVSEKMDMEILLRV